jgi:hypothetical protein
MPWSIKIGFGNCAGFAVVEDGTDKVEGCHDTRPEAEAQLAALDATESDSGDVQAGGMDPTRKKKLPKARAGAYTEPVFIPEGEVAFVPKGSIGGRMELDEPSFVAVDKYTPTGIAYVKLPKETS